MMASTPPDNVSVRDLLRACPRLRTDVAFSRQRYAGQDCYVIEDRARSKYHRVGPREHDFIRQLNGRTTVAEALAHSATSLGPDALSESDATTIVNWLIHNDLVHTQGSLETSELVHNAGERRKTRWLQRINPLFIRLPLFNPNRVLDVLAPAAGLLLSRVFMLVWIVMLLSAGYIVAANHDSFAASAHGILAPNNWLILLAAWICLKTVHECAHGIVCKHHGGDVLEAGVIFVLFLPITYVDATSSWSFRSKWQRITTAAAGMYVELFLASAATFVWLHAAHPVIEHVAFNVILIASINALLFNANPLMKFDGYYVFSDWMEIPNLYGQGQRYIRYLARRYLLGIDAQPVELPGHGTPLVKAYGVLSFLWRIFVVVTLLFIANSLFYGAGVAIVVLALVVMVGVPLVRLVPYLVKGNEHEQPDLKRFAICLIAAGGLVYAGLFLADWRRTLELPATVTYAQYEPVRAGAAGFVEAVHVDGSQRVEAGDILVRLHNPGLVTEARRLRLSIEKLSVERRIHLAGGKLSQAQVAQRRIDEKQEKLRDIGELEKSLVVRAPRSGVVLGRNLDRLQGRFVKRGAELMSIGEPGRKELHVSVGEGSIDRMRARVGEEVAFRIRGHGLRRGRGEVQRVDPRASRQVLFPQLTVIGGGSLPVKSKPVGAGAGAGDAYRHIAPRFEAVVGLGDDTSSALAMGETGEVIVSGKPRPVYRHLQELVRDWREGVAKQAGKLVHGA